MSCLCSVKYVSGINSERGQIAMKIGALMFPSYLHEHKMLVCTLVEITGLSSSVNIVYSVFCLS